MPAEEAPEDSNRALGAQPEPGPLGDLTPLQWGNWANDLTVRADGAAANPSINVPDFGASGSAGVSGSAGDAGAGRAGNMDKQIVVALIDTGVYTEHPDLDDVVYHFTPGQQEALGCWEKGYNAVGKGMYGNVRDEASISLGHGTHTAGIIGAEWNGFGTSGVASNVKIVCIELADADGKESLADALAAFSFVDRFNEQASEEEHIRVTSNSWSEYMSSKALDAVLRSLGERWGTVSVFSAGNDGKNNDYYEKTPSSHADNPYVIVVANSTPAERLYDQSEYGTAAIDLAAPGTNILSTTIEESGAYYPDAVRESNLLYFGFDGEDELPIRVSQVYRDGNPDLYDDEPVVLEDLAEPASSSRFYGSGCLKIEIDPDYAVSSDSWSTSSESYDLQFDIDLAGTDIAGRLGGIRDLRFGFAFSTEEGSECTPSYASSNIAYIPAGASVTRPVLAGDALAVFNESAAWGVSDFIITRDIRPGEGTDPDVISVIPEGDVLSVKLRLKLPKDRTTIFIDSIGIGTQTAPYEFATGTSMAARMQRCRHRPSGMSLSTGRQ